jgi:2,3-bisphosphoglycerate-dependent phosphoglycerate mutase
MKTIYLVRHGQTDGNQAGFYQHLDTPLSEIGRKQAENVSRRFASIPIDAVIASDMERANDTARSIAKVTGHSVITESIFREIARPSMIRGKLIADPSTSEIRKFTDENFATGLRHSDEENFFDLKDRGIQALKYVLNRQEETLVVVTHGIFLKMLMAVMAFGEDLEVDVYRAFNDFLYANNTGITKCTYDGKWLLVNWNDDAHLG